MALSKLTTKQFENAKDGSHGDGGGLTLRVRNGNRSWVFRFTLNGKAREIGLGDLSLSEARERAGVRIVSRCRLRAEADQVYKT